MSGGVKHDDGKRRWDLFPWDAYANCARRFSVDHPPEDALVFAEIAGCLGAWFHRGSRIGLEHAAARTLEWLGSDLGADTFIAEEAVVVVLEFGARKYSERNWEKGISHARTFAAALRHLVAYQRGELFDKETGFDHRAHAACELLFALAFEVRGMGGRLLSTGALDDRPGEVSGAPGIEFAA